MTLQANATDAVRRNDDTFTGAPGVRLHRIAVAPPEGVATRARLAVVHGYGDHAGRYVEAMTWLAAHGVECHAVDLRGHGKSSGRRGYVRRWEEYLDDLGAFLDLPALRPAPGGPPMFVLGHSHGGLVVAVAGIRGLLGRPGIGGVILSAPYFVNAITVPWHKRVGARLGNVFCPWMLVRSGVKTGMTTSDPAMQDDSRHDPLMLRRATPRWFLTTRRVQSEALANAGAFDLPLLVVTGDADAIADPRGAARFHDRAASTDKSIITYPGFLHEPLRERGRARVFADVLTWIADRSAPGPALTT
jgi:alpha-beta hydrolase superfamily lysophospholipase